MYIIPNITDAPLQQNTIVLEDGTSLVMTIYFIPQQYGWFLQSLTYNNATFVLNGYRIVNSPNMLHQYRNQIPFGLACVSPSGREPTLQQDFSSGNSILYLLNSAEVEQFTEYLLGIT